MDTLLTIVVLVLISGISAWLKKRGETAETDSTSQLPRPPGRPAPSPHPPTQTGHPSERRPSPRSWEEELRRLLEGEPAPPPAAPRPASPPRTPLPGPGRPQPAPPVITVLRPSPPPAPAEIPAELLRPGDRPLHVGDLKQTGAARGQSERIKRRAAVELRRSEAVVARNLSRAHVVHRDNMTAEITSARALLDSPHAARRAVIVSVILGPPVGL